MKSTFICSLAIVSLVGCVGANLDDDNSDDVDSIDQFDSGKSDAADLLVTRSMNCRTTDTAQRSVKVALTRVGKNFDAQATANGQLLWKTTSQRPSLNVMIEDGVTTAVNEFVDFRPSGLESIPAVAPARLDIMLNTGRKTLTFGADAATPMVTLSCLVSAPKLIAYLGLTPTARPYVAETRAVGFDIDDTLAFTTPTFARAFGTGGTPKPDDAVFWNQANACDQGCAAASITAADGTIKQLSANVASTAKAKALELIDYHRRLGHDVYAITARPDIAGDGLRNYMEAEFGLDRAHVFFEPDLSAPGNPAGKTDRIESLRLDVFYGDSDSDITDALKVTSRTVVPVRFLRNPTSSNRKDGRLNKYHPGYFGEAIVADSYR
jgi:acid phosphatase class B